MRFDVALMDHLGAELALDDVVRGLETLLEVAALELDMAGNVGGLARILVSSRRSRRIGASGFIASITSSTGGNTSYSTSMRASASSAICGLVAATAATPWPWYRTLSLAIRFSIR